MVRANVAASSEVELGRADRPPGPQQVDARVGAHAEAAQVRLVAVPVVLGRAHRQPDPRVQLVQPPAHPVDQVHLRGDQVGVGGAVALVQQPRGDVVEQQQEVPHAEPAHLLELGEQQVGVVRVAVADRQPGGDAVRDRDAAAVGDPDRLGQLCEPARRVRLAPSPPGQRIILGGVDESVHPVPCDELDHVAALLVGPRRAVEALDDAAHREPRVLVVRGGVKLARAQQPLGVLAAPAAAAVRAGGHGDGDAVVAGLDLQHVALVGVHRRDAHPGEPGVLAPPLDHDRPAHSDRTRGE